MRSIHTLFQAYVADGVAAPERVERYLLAIASVIVRLRSPVVIAITGSVGKTTTATAIAHLLSSPECRAHVGRVVCTVDNMNNHDGLSLTVMGISRWQRGAWQRLALYVRAPVRMLLSLLSPSYPKVLVLEYGSDRSGYLAPMVRAVAPTVAVITNVGQAHLAGMRDLRGVMEEKATLLDGNPPPQLVILGDQHEFVAELAARTTSQTIRIAESGTALASRIAQEVARFLGVPEELIRAVRSEISLERRLQRIDLGDLCVIDDSFNANPTSMKYALSELASVHWPHGRKVAVLGGMAELGAESASLHDQIGLVARATSDKVISVGDAAVRYDADIHFRDSTDCSEQLLELVEAGDLILVKGSASARMDVVVQRIVDGAACRAAKRGAS